jgi:hypothetical protein
MGIGLFKRKADPISARERALKQEIAQLESRIKQLNEQPTPAPPVLESKVRSVVTNTQSSNFATRRPPEPVFVEVTRKAEVAQAEPVPETALFNNELGVPRYNLAGLFKRILGGVRSSPPSNPQFVQYLAAGSIQGLRPLRYEKRVARNRFIILAVFFLALLWGILAMFLGRH